MRIVIDMQGSQTESRFRGIGRYTMAFAQAVVRNRGEHEVILALSGLFPDTIDPIRSAFDGLLSKENFRVWQVPSAVRECESGNQARREVAEIMREAFLAKLNPDIIHISSLFEGYVDDAVSSIGRFDIRTPVSVTLHDLIPLLNPNHYLSPNPRYKDYFERKLESLKRASTYLAVSESSRQEGICNLGREPELFVNTLEAVEPHFRPRAIADDNARQLKQKFGIRQPFVLYTGGADERKNLPRLIKAYAALPSRLRDRHQLIFAGKMPEGDIARLKRLAQLDGLKDDELLFTGYVSDEELIDLYNLCELYVFPSWHEGFGLPALEAMACGAPVIGADTSSLPEVIGLSEALFDPYDVKSISLKIARGLEDKDFRSRLRKHGMHQAQKFSWDETAMRALSAWESLPRLQRENNKYLTHTLAYDRFLIALANCFDPNDEPNLIELSNCLAHNERAAIERQLLVDVSELCQRDAATGVQRVVRSYLKWLLHLPPRGFKVEPVYATREGGYRYARHFTLRFLGCEDAEIRDDQVRWQRGDLFFGLDMQHHVQLAHADFYRQLKRDGVTVKFLVYDLLPIQLADLFMDPNAKRLHEQWLTMIATTDEAVCISKATADAFEGWVAENEVLRSQSFRISWVHIGADIDGSKPSLGRPKDAATVLTTLRKRHTFLCVSTLEPRKRQQQILEAIECLWRDGKEINLAFVGQQGWKVESLAERLRNHPENGQRLFWLEGISDEYLDQVYASSTCLVAASANEGFGLSLIEAARCGLPIVARDIPIFREVVGEHAHFFNGDAAEDLAESLSSWLEKYQRQQHPTSTSIRWSTWEQSTEKLKVALIEQNYSRRQLLVDVSELAQRDAKTGIQRVVRGILKEWLLNPPEGYRVEPVYATVEQGYRYARQFMQRFIGTNQESATDDLIDYAPGDIFFGLDLQPQVQVAQRESYQNFRQAGVEVQFLVHDLLCVQMPQYFPVGSTEGFADWLNVVVESDGAICVSQTTAEALEKWISCKHAKPINSLKITWSHNGADLDCTVPTKGLPPDTEHTLWKMRSKPSFLVVGTIEPRKGHAQVLDAFEQLWRSNVDVNLVIVGKQGWMVESLAARLRAHSESDWRLFWLESISDEYLEKVYAASTCLIAASHGEGFGLPLIEAAQHKLPIIARDISVFREVAGTHAFYFQANEPDELTRAVVAWLALQQEGQHPKSDNMPWLTWSESAARLGKVILSKR